MTGEIQILASPAQRGGQIVDEIAPEVACDPVQSGRTAGLQGSHARLHVVIATTGRARVLRQVVERLGRQTRPADGIMIVGAVPEDIAGLAEGGADNMQVMISAKGSCKQRNAALDLLAGRSDIVVFFDDDFVPAHDYLENLEKLMQANPAVLGVTGYLVGDGAQTGEIAFDDAVRRLDDYGVRPSVRTDRCKSLYGCNMAIRLSAAAGLRFDEMLPLYGWQEDVDFTHQLSWRGPLLRTSAVTGVHLGVRGGRTSGRRLGYSQVANIVYLRRKGTMRPWLGERLMFQNIVSNVVRSIWPEPDIDRRGRLTGNLLAIRDLLRGRIDPRRIETF